MKIIGLSGKARAGKDTAADILVERHGFTKIALADPLKRVCFEVFGGKMTERHLWGDGRDEPIEALGGLAARRALQTLGTEWGRGCYVDVWIDCALKLVADAALRKVDPHTYNDLEYRPRKYGRLVGWSGVGPKVEEPLFVIPDVRFINEVRAIRKADGEVWRIERPDGGLEGAAAEHISENELPEAAGRTRRLYAADGDPAFAAYDGVIRNDGDLAKLVSAVEFMLEGP